MDHPGSTPSLLQGKPILFGTVHGAIGKPHPHLYNNNNIHCRSYWSVKYGDL